MKLKSLLEKLTTYEPNENAFISLYLNAKVNERGREDYKIWLKKALKEESDKFEEESEGAKTFTQVIEKINYFLENEAEPSANGLAVFASLGDENYFETVQLDTAFPENSLLVFDRPHIFPLVRIIEQNPKYCVLWADTNKADIYVFGGENTLNIDTETNAKVEEIENTVTRRTKVGGWSQARYQRHIENFHLQHAKETVAEVEKLMRDSKIEHLVLCGDETTIIPVLRPQLSKEFEEKVVSAINMSQYASEEEIRGKTHEIMAIENAVQDMTKADRMFDAAKAASGLGTLGVEKTLAALSNGQVEELLINSNFDAVEYSAKKVKKVLKDYAPGEDNSSTDELPNVRDPRQIADELLVRALNSAAKIVFIEDESILREAGGVGAVLRYNQNSTAKA